MGSTMKYLSPNSIILFQEHPFLVEDRTREVDMVGWVAGAIAAREARREAVRASQSSNSHSPHSSPASIATEGETPPPASS